MKHILLIQSVRISLEDDDTTRTVLLNGIPRFAIELIDTEYHSDGGVGECMRHCKIQRNTLPIIHVHLIKMDIFFM